MANWEIFTFFIFQDIDSKNFKNILYIKLISLI